MNVPRAIAASCLTGLLALTAVASRAGELPRAVASDGWEEIVPLTKELKDDYEAKFAAAVVDPSSKGDVDSIITRILKNKAAYSKVEDATHVKWFVVALIHNMECDGRFDCHLHNGDPLTARTRHEPKGLPATGRPPFTWQQSAVDALQYEGFDVWTDWSIAGVLYKLEVYNGMGYRSHGVASPYLWSKTQIYTRGKYTSDGRFDPTAVSAQIGAAAILRRMIDQHLIVEFSHVDAPPATSAADDTCRGMAK